MEKTVPSYLLAHPNREHEPSPPSCTVQRAASRAFTVRSHLSEDIETSVFAELELVILTFCTGIQDAISFPDYHAFASNQTGNTVFLMLAIVMPQFDGDMFITANIGAALGFFLGAGWLTGQISHFVGPRRRWWLILCNVFQSCLVLVAAAIQHLYGTDKEGAAAVAVVGLLAFASGSQVVQSRSLAVPEISTAMATAAWVDLMIDPHMFTWKNRSRNRRIAFLLALASGSLLGAGIYRTAGSATAIFLSAGGKFLVSMMYLFNGADRSKESHVENGDVAPLSAGCELDSDRSSDERPASDHHFPAPMTHI